MYIRPAKLFRVDAMQRDGTEESIFAYSFAEAIVYATATADVALPTPKIFEVDTTTFEAILQRSWLS